MKVYERICANAVVFLFLGLLSCCATLPPAPPPEDEASKNKKAYEEQLKDAKPINGLFNIYLKEDTGAAILEILPEQFGPMMLCSVTRSQGDANFFDSSSMMYNFALSFRRVNDRVQIINYNTSVRADKGTPAERALRRGVSDSIFSSAKFLGKPHPETGAVLVSLNDLFLIDVNNVANDLNEITKVDFSFDRDNSSFSVLKSFPENTDIETKLHFRSGKYANAPLSADPRSLFVSIYYSFMKLPESDYMPRIADDRVGYFLEAYEDYTDINREDPYVYLVHRWNLKKADPNAEISIPVKPIVFWLQNTIPVEFREPITKGILAWNEAFEKAGFKDAIVVKQQLDDADWDPADVRYNTICWMINPIKGYAVGPSHANPFTGELYDADIRISADIVRYSWASYQEIVNPLGAGSGLRACTGENCDYAMFKMVDAGFTVDYLTAIGDIVIKDPKKHKEFVDAYVMDLLLHEVGHTLGLRHNFKASSAFSMEELSDPEFTAKYGISASVMDYNASNIVPDRARQGAYFQTRPGVYDLWAIEYGYKPVAGAKVPEDELPELVRIASRAGEPRLVYGTDEDAMDSPDGMDPYCIRHDQGSDSIVFYRQRIQIAKEIWKNLGNVFVPDDGRYQKLRRIWQRGFGMHLGGVHTVVKFIGGIAHTRLHMGDTDKKRPFEPISADKQREAMKFLRDNVFNFRYDETVSELANKMLPNRMPRFEGDGGPLNMAFHNMLLSTQANVLNYLYNPVLLTRMSDLELHYKEGQDYYGIKEMFGAVFDAIWEDAGSTGRTDSFSRGLQRRHFEVLSGFVLASPPDVPADAVTLARKEIDEINKLAIDALKKEDIDEYSKAHFEDIRVRSEAVLNAQVELKK